MWHSLLLAKDYNHSSFTKSEPLSPIMTVGAWVFPVTTLGIMELSTTLKHLIPCTFKYTKIYVAFFIIG